MKSFGKKTDVWVKVGRIDDTGVSCGAIVEFTGKLVDSYQRGHGTCELYKCPKGYRVYESDETGAEHRLYPSEVDSNTGRVKYPLYSAEELAEDWPELGGLVDVFEF